jgi:hypothetical protein
MSMEISHMKSQNEVRSVVHRITRFMRFAFRRMCAMAGVWTLLGTVMGLNCEQLLRGDRIGLVANVLAWMIVMCFMGALLSLFGGRPVDSWVGAGFGAIIVAAVGVQLPVADASTHMQINFGALLGALVAATCWPWVRMIIAVTLRVRSMLVSAH